MCGDPDLPDAPESENTGGNEAAESSNEAADTAADAPRTSDHAGKASDSPHTDDPRRNNAVGACGVTESTMLTGDRLGDIVIGRSLDEVARTCPVLRDTTELRSEGQMERVVTFAVAGEQVEAEIVDGNLWRLTIDEPAFRTSDLLSVGTSVARLLRYDGVRPLIGEGRLYVQVSEHCGLSFRLSKPASAVGSGEPDAASLRTLPAETHVAEILVVGCPEE